MAMAFHFQNPRPMDTIDTFLEGDVIASTTAPALERRSSTAKNRVQCKQDIVIAWLQDFYTHPGRIEDLMPILKGESAISLRLIDYFVTNYAKKNNTSYMLDGRQFLVYFHYKRELNAYSKRLFDPFCRRERILFQARGHEEFVTTVGQLNFFRWAIEKKIVGYITENREVIERDMNSTLREHYSRSTTRTTSVATSAPITPVTSAPTSTIDGESSSQGSRKKRSELTQSAMKKVNFHRCDVVVSFS
jgi:hypothetical protein